MILARAGLLPPQSLLQRLPSSLCDSLSFSTHKVTGVIPDLCRCAAAAEMVTTGRRPLLAAGHLAHESQTSPADEAF